jgi:hypothetical protein
MINGSDYRWFADEFYPYWVNGFCLTFIADRSATWVKDALQSAVGVSPMEIGGPDQLFATTVHDAGNGSVMLERGGYAGYTARIATMLSRNTRVAVVIHFIVGSPKFAFVENGTLVCGFNIMDPESRGGGSPGLPVIQLD